MRTFQYQPLDATMSARTQLNNYWRPGNDPEIPSLLLEDAPAPPSGGFQAAFALRAQGVLGVGRAA